MNTPSLFSGTNGKNTLASSSTALLVAGLLAGCSTHPEPLQQTFELPRKIDTTSILVKKTLQEHGKELAIDIKEKIHDPEFHSLQRIKQYLTGKLKKRGISPVIISAHIVPFIPNTDGTYDYIIISINSAQGGIDFSLKTDNRESTVGMLTTIIDNFERQTQEQVLKTFAEGLKESGGKLDTSSLEKKIHTVLNNQSHLFIQHGYQYQGVEIGNKESTRETEIKLKIYDIPNDKIIEIPIPTGIIPEPTKNERRGSDDETGITMIA